MSTRNNPLDTRPVEMVILFWCHQLRRRWPSPVNLGDETPDDIPLRFILHISSSCTLLAEKQIVSSCCSATRLIRSDMHWPGKADLVGSDQIVEPNRRVERSEPADCTSKMPTIIRVARRYFQTFWEIRPSQSNHIRAERSLHGSEVTACSSVCRRHVRRSAVCALIIFLTSFGLGALIQSSSM